ncbi:MAG: pyrroline-5-carboxylate reductase [Limnochordia bacterium]|nr:pyrroline-5-carboxylate reductase [Limnochordia bacterium]MDD4518911.1 pyrroline-5-carboxylate reductase [Limnochordia bacterium]
MLEGERLVVFGAGNMGKALLSGVLSAKLFPEEQILVVEKLEAKRAEVAQLGIQTTTDLAFACSFGTILVLAVKPKDIPDLLGELAPLVKEEQLVISIAAGISIQMLKSCLPAALVRVMPNTPALIGQGISAIAPEQSVTKEEQRKVAKLLGALGECVFVSEDLIDAVTGLSGSGPAYVFLLIEALIEGGVAAGLSRDVARRLTLQTVIGSARLLEETGQHPGVLKDQVTSPAGTTAAGLRILEERGFRSALIEAVLSATARSKELARGDG